MASKSSSATKADPVSILYFTLISAESWTRVFVRELSRQQRWLATAPEPKEFWYPGPPENGIRPHEELMIDLGSGPMLQHHAPWVKRYDAYNSLESQWRNEVFRAEQAVVAAAGALDQPGEHPLRRTTTPLRRALMELRSSVPSTIEIGYRPPTDSQVVPLLWKRLRAVSKWIDDLRLLRPPQAPMDLSKTPKPNEGDPEWDGLDPDAQVVLQTLLEMDAVPDGKRISGEDLARKALGLRDRSGVEPILTVLEELGYVETSMGRYGGRRLTPRGQVLVERNLRRSS